MNCRYGSDPDQYAELHIAERGQLGVAVVIHGGFWRAAYDASLGRQLARDLTERGWTTYNVEYRRVGKGGGWPTTLQDVSDAIDWLSELDLDLSRVVAIGHSAGGHLATWAAGRAALPPLGAGILASGLGDRRRVPGRSPRSAHRCREGRGRFGHPGSPRRAPR